MFMLIARNPVYACLGSHRGKPGRHHSRSQLHALKPSPPAQSAPDKGVTMSPSLACHQAVLISDADAAQIADADAAQTASRSTNRSADAPRPRTSLPHHETVLGHVAVAPAFKSVAVSHVVSAAPSSHPDRLAERLGHSSSNAASTPFLGPPPRQLKGPGLPPTGPSRPRLLPTQAVDQEVDNSLLSEFQPLSRRGQSFPNTVHLPAHVRSSQLSALSTIQQAISVSRRVSVASLLQRMSTGDDDKSSQRSEQDSTIGSSAIAPCGPLSLDASSTHTQRVKSSNLRFNNVQIHTSLAANTADQYGSRVDVSQAKIQEAQSASRKMDHLAADVRMQSFLSSAGMAATPNNMPLHSNPASLTDISHDLECHDSLPVSDDMLQMHDDAAQQGHLRMLKRTISDAALGALESVDSLRCTIIEYSQLEVKRKVGGGSIGQVSLSFGICRTVGLLLAS